MKRKINTTGLLAVTLGGSKGLSGAISSDGFDISYSGIKDMVFGMSRVKDYNTAMADKTGIMQKLYAVENYALYSGLSYDSDFVQALDDYMFNGNPDELSFDFNTEENKRDGNTIYIDKKLISGLISTHNGVIGDINQMAVLTAKIGHEYKHDGNSSIDSDSALMAQQILKNNPSMTKKELEEKLYEAGMTNADDVADEIFEEVNCNKFEVSVWEGIKQNFYDVKDVVLDTKLALYKLDQLDPGAFVKFLTTFYEFGGDYSEAPSQEFIQKLNQINESYKSVANEYLFKMYAYDALEEYKKKKGSDTTSKKFKNILNCFLIVNSSYISCLENKNMMELYTLGEFNKDMEIAFDRTLDISEEDYEKLKTNQLNSQFIDTTDVNMNKVYGKVFGDIFKSMADITMGKGLKEAQARFDGVVQLSNQFDVSNIGYKSSSTWFLETYDNLNDGVSNRDSFFNYYLNNTDSAQLKRWNEVLNDTRITVVSGNQHFNSTHFIANAIMFDKYIQTLKIMETYAPIDQDGPVKLGMFWNEGYRSQKEYIYLTNYSNLKGKSLDYVNKYILDNFIRDKTLGLNNGHCNNQSIDITGIGYYEFKDGGYSDKFRLFTKDQLKYIADIISNNNYLSFMELKGSGFHIQLKDSDIGLEEVETSIVFGSWPSDSDEMVQKYLEVYLKQYIDSNYKNLTQEQKDKLLNQLIQSNLNNYLNQFSQNGSGYYIYDAVIFNTILESAYTSVEVLYEQLYK